MGEYLTTQERAYLAHHGVQGMKWGVRRYQNADGSMTSLGKRRMKTVEKIDKSYDRMDNNIRSQLWYYEKIGDQKEKAKLTKKMLDDNQQSRKKKELSLYNGNDNYEADSKIEDKRVYKNGIKEKTLKTNSTSMTSFSSRSREERYQSTMLKIIYNVKNQDISSLDSKKGYEL